jgi:hypothetical protein
MSVLLLLACVYRPPPETPRLVSATAAEVPVHIDELQGRVRVVVRAGSAYDPPGREGLSYLAAASLADMLGATFEAGQELVRFDVPATRAAELGAVLASGPSSEALERARVANVTWPSGAACDALAAAAWNIWAYPGHPYGHAVRGRSSVLPTITRPEVIAFVQRRYVRESVMVGRGAPDVPVGGLDLLPARLSPHALPAPTLDTPRGTLVVIAPVEQGCVLSGEPLRDMPSPRVPDLLGPALRGAPMSELLAEGRSTVASTLAETPLEQLAALRASAPTARIVAVVPQSFGLQPVGASEDTGMPGVQGLMTVEDLFR